MIDMVESLSDTVKLDIYRQMRVCSEKYKPIFASFASGSTDVARISDFLAEVLHFFEALQPYYEQNREFSRFAYLAAVDEIVPYADNYSLILREMYYDEKGHRLNSRNPGDKQEIGLRRGRVLDKFVLARQALEKFAFDLNLVTIEAKKGGMGI